MYMKHMIINTYKFETKFCAIKANKMKPEWRFTDIFLCVFGSTFSIPPFARTNAIALCWMNRDIVLLPTSYIQ